MKKVQLLQKNHFIEESLLIMWRKKNGVCVLVFSLHFATSPPQFSRNEVIKHGNNCAKCNAEFILRWSCKWGFPDYFFLYGCARSLGWLAVHVQNVNYVYMLCRPQDTSLYESLLGVFLIVRHGWQSEPKRTVKHQNENRRSIATKLTETNIKQDTTWNLRNLQNALQIKKKNTKPRMPIDPFHLSLFFARCQKSSGQLNF